MRRQSMMLALAVAAMATASAHAPAQSTAPPAAKGEPAAAPESSPQQGKGGLPGTWPKVITQPAKQPPAWSEAEVAAGRARCTELLKGLDVVAIPADPIKDGGCGAPAPMKLISFGRSPEVALSPPVTVTCEMIVAMHTWFKSHVQPAARDLLASPIVRVNTMSDYSCRNAYGRTKSRLSEHGKANALDIRDFVTASGVAVAVLNDWGMTGRDVIAAHRANEARKAAEAAAAAKAAAGKAQAAGGKPPSPHAAPVEPGKGIPGGAPGVIITIPGVGGPKQPAMGLAPPSRLGGPKSKQASVLPAIIAEEKRSQFLRRIHASACRVFGTVLGPEANEAHRNHFHVDMAERRSGSFCE